MTHPDTAADILDRNHVTATFGSLEAARDLLDYFLETTAPLVDAAAAGLAAGDGEEARRAAHAAAGAARTAGAVELARVCSAIEVAAAGGELDRASAEVPAMRAAFARVAREIRDRL